MLDSDVVFLHLDTVVLCYHSVVAASRVYCVSDKLAATLELGTAGDPLHLLLSIDTQ